MVKAEFNFKSTHNFSQIVENNQENHSIHSISLSLTLNKTDIFRIQHYIDLDKLTIEQAKMIRAHAKEAGSRHMTSS